MLRLILVPTAPAELLDKVAILEVKEERIIDPEKLKNVRHELELLRQIAKNQIPPSPELNKLFSKLRTLSEKGWDIEDGKRDCERRQDFGPRFIELARGAFKNNDERATIKKQINLLLKSDIVEEKSYT
ncbi:MAG: hypothetical protein HYT48_01755 [Candidatus Vogelbacteria bacterium]|nr:hypothetical protein [Candidatus Vogelbacteria bacterium]